MTNIYQDKDADLKVLKNETIAIIGYGNQGRSQALNMRDSGLKVIVGNISDASLERAKADGFEAYSIRDASEKATIVFLLLPDEVQPKVYEAEIKPTMKKGKALVFAHGYNLHYGFLKPQADIDVLLLAPRMVGKFVRELYEKGTGAPVFLCAHQDASGKAMKRVLALAKGIGATRVGAMEVNVGDETELDHFSEHWIAPMISRVLILGYEVLTEMGYDKDAVLMETYMSGELGEVCSSLAKDGLVTQLPFHSRTSQFGQLLYADRVMPNDAKELIRELVMDIKLGTFAKEWQLEQILGYPVFNKMMEQARAHPINQAEADLKKRVKVEID